MSAAKTETADTLAGALAAVQSQLPRVTKGKKADTGKYSYTYADLSDIAQAIHPLLGANGLAWITKPTLNADGAFVLAYSLRHVSGEVEAGEYPLPDPAKTPPQSVGSAITYGRRYCLCAVTGVVADEDDDGAAAQGTTAKKADRIRKPAQPVVDEWTAPEGQTPPTPPESRVTDQAWFEDYLARIDRADSPAILRGLHSEAAEQHRTGKLTKADLDLAGTALTTRKGVLDKEAATADWPAVAKPGGEAA